MIEQPQLVSNFVKKVPEILLKLACSIFAEEMPGDLCESDAADIDDLLKVQRDIKASKAFRLVHEVSRRRFGRPPTTCSIMAADQHTGRSAFDICKLLHGQSPAKIIAPMVKYSSQKYMHESTHRAEFRSLCRTYGCQIGYTPMVVAEDVVHSGNWHRSDLYSLADEQALIVQFAANHASDLLQCAQKVYWGCDGVDINLGCPQKFALRRRFGAALLDDFELVSDMVRSVRQALPNSVDKPFSVSIKIRIMPDLRKTIDLCQKAEYAGVSYITVHGRYPHQKDHNLCPANWDAIRTVKDAVTVPIVANGSVDTVADYERVSDRTGCDGVMVATGLLENPALFEYDETSLECILRWFSLFKPPPSREPVSLPSELDCSQALPYLETWSPTVGADEQQPACKLATHPSGALYDPAFVTFHRHLIQMLEFADKREKGIFASFFNRNEIANFLINDWHRAVDFSTYVTEDGE